jgi:hypothetical protein
MGSAGGDCLINRLFRVGITFTTINPQDKTAKDLAENEFRCSGKHFYGTKLL